MSESRRDLLRGVLASGLLLAAKGTAQAKGPTQDPELAAALRDQVRRQNGAIRSYSLRLVRHDETAAGNDHGEAGILSNVETLHDGYYYLDRLCDPSGSPFAFQLRGPKYEVVGKLVDGEPRDARRLDTKKWPSSPNASEILPVPGSYPTTLLQHRALLSGRECGVLQQGQYVYWVDIDTIDVLRAEELASDGKPQEVRTYSAFETALGDRFRVPHSIEVQSYLAGGEELRETFQVREASFWATPQAALFDVQTFLKAITPGRG